LRNATHQEKTKGLLDLALAKKFARPQSRSGKKGKRWTTILKDLINDIYKEFIPMDAGRQMKTENYNKSNKQNYFKKIFSSKKKQKRLYTTLRVGNLASYL